MRPLLGSGSEWPWTAAAAFVLKLASPLLQGNWEALFSELIGSGLGNGLDSLPASELHIVDEKARSPQPACP